MPTRVIKFSVTESRRASFEAAFRAAQKGIKGEEGFLEARLFAETRVPGVYFAYERFRDAAAQEIHASQPHTRNFVAVIKEGGVEAEVLELRETAPAPVPAKAVAPEDDVFVIFFIFTVRDGYRERLLERFETHISETRKEAGNLLFDLYTVKGDASLLVVYEHWRKESDVWDIHISQPYSVETGALMSEAVEGALEPYMHFVKEVM